MENSKTTVVNVNHDQYDVFIGRGSFWGNPFKIGVHGTRKDVITLYKAHYHNNLSHRISELKGKRLGCFCAPKACHGDFLAEQANNEGLDI